MTKQAARQSLQNQLNLPQSLKDATLTPVMKNPNITLEPIGVIKNKVEQPAKESGETATSQIIIKDEFGQALSGIEEFSHIIVTYWMHQISTHQRSTMKVHPRGRSELPLFGVFATRSPMRPNPLGITTVKLIERQGNTLKVSSLDALDNTPVIDIKPYLPRYDSPSQVKTPNWVADRGANHKRGQDYRREK